MRNPGLNMRVGGQAALGMGSLMAAAIACAAGFNSGSTGADGAFSPTADIVLSRPASGVFNYTTINIPAGVTVSFDPNYNAPVVMLASGNVTIAGTINLNGGNSATTSGAADNPSGGLPGPGGFAGGRGGAPGNSRTGATGLGPGGGGGGTDCKGNGYDYLEGGGGAGFGAAGAPSKCVLSYSASALTESGIAGAAYGAVTMLPLVGGSGGGGGSGGRTAAGSPGTGGGGGGGALLLVSSGAVSLSGSIQAKGGNSGTPRNVCNWSQLDNGAPGGGGSGGAVRIVASSFTGNGNINVGGGVSACGTDVYVGGNGAVGRSSVETLTAGTFDVATMPSLRITSLGNINAPAQPTGIADVTLPAELANPVTVNIAASGVPTGTVVKLTLSQPYAVNTIANSTPLAGTLASSTASASIDIPSGPSTLIATTTYTLSLAMGESLKVYTGGERVEKVELAAVLGGETKATLITVSGKAYTVPAAVLAMMAG